MVTKWNTITYPALEKEGGRTGGIEENSENNKQDKCQKKLHVGIFQFIET